MRSDRYRRYVARPALFAALLSGCGSDSSPPATSGSTTGSAPPSSASASARASASSGTAPAAPHETVGITVVGTNDLHGRITALPLLGGYLDVIRGARAESGGGVVLVDAGDMFQGTLESNLLEGKPVRDAYAMLGYAAVAIGNHEFDYGPVGPAIVPAQPSDDPRGALKALTKDAPFPFLTANLALKSGGKPDWTNVAPSMMIANAGVFVGVIGVSTRETLTTTIAPNVADLAVSPLADAVLAEAKSLRSSGASVVLVAAHAGGKCKAFGHDDVTDHCETDSEIWDLARALPEGSVDVIVAGHTHAGVSHVVNGIPIIESYAYGRAFGRVDLVVDKVDKRVVGRELKPPRDLCPGVEKPDFTACQPGDYDGAPVVRRADVASLIAPAVDGARERRAAKVGPTLPDGMPKAFDKESPLGNLFADLMLASVPKADIALMNGGGLREDLPRGELLYGAFFEAFPFDNRIATVKLTVRDLTTVLASHLKRGTGGILSIAGARIVARCKDGALDIQLIPKKGKEPLAPDTMVTVVGSDFMFLGGDAFWGDLPVPAYEISDVLIRDAMERELKSRPSIGVADVFNEKKPRLDLDPKRPMICKPK
ncbi:MAG: 5'-nucleotidase C-terminal domain-containing protein [Polyangiaceae bacterium]